MTAKIWTIELLRNTLNLLKFRKICLIPPNLRLILLSMRMNLVKFLIKLKWQRRKQPRIKIPIEVYSYCSTKLIWFLAIVSYHRLSNLSRKRRKPSKSDDHWFKIIFIKFILFYQVTKRYVTSRFYWSWISYVQKSYFEFHFLGLKEMSIIIIQTENEVNFKCNKTKSEQRYNL